MNIEELRTWSIDYYRQRKARKGLSLGATHGPSHWERVYQNGLELLDEGVDPVVVAVFA